MFKVVDIKSLLWPVEIKVPKGDGSADFDRHEVKVEYKVLNTDQMAELMEKNTINGQPWKVEDMVVGWDDIHGPDGEKMTFSKQKLKKLMKTPYITAAFIEGFWLCHEGYAGKNS